MFNIGTDKPVYHKIPKGTAICPHCIRPIFGEGYKKCPHCGNPILWEKKKAVKAKMVIRSK